MSPVDSSITPVREHAAAIGHANDDIIRLELIWEKLSGRGGRKGHRSIAAEGERRGKHGAVGGAGEPRGGGVIPTSAGPATGGSSVVGVGPRWAGDAVG